VGIYPAPQPSWTGDVNQSYGQLTQQILETEGYCLTGELEPMLGCVIGEIRPRG